MNNENDVDRIAASAALLVLAEYNIPPDIQELLVYGNPRLGVKPGALSAAFKATVLSYKRTERET